MVQRRAHLTPLWGQGVGGAQKGEAMCAFLSRWWLTSQKWSQESCPRPRSLVWFLPLHELWLLSLCIPFSGPASLLSTSLEIIQSSPDPLMVVTSFPCLDGKTDAQTGFLNVTCRNSDGGLRVKFFTPKNLVERINA